MSSGFARHFLNFWTGARPRVIPWQGAATAVVRSGADRRSAHAQHEFRGTKSGVFTERPETLGKAKPVRLSC
jgi:hypothetical protein